MSEITINVPDFPGIPERIIRFVIEKYVKNNADIIQNACCIADDIQKSKGE